MPKKRKVSAKTLAALARGRRILKAKRAGKKAVTHKRKVRTVKHKIVKHRSRKVVTMPRKRRTSRTRRTRRIVHHARRVYSRVRHHARRVRHSIKGFAGKTGMKDILMTGAIAAGGAILGSVILAKIPLKNDKIKAIIPIAAGVILASGKVIKAPVAKTIGLGMVVLGALSLVRQTLPQVPLLAGEQDLSEISYDPSLLGLPDTRLGLPMYGGGYMGSEAFLSPADVN